MARLAIGPGEQLTHSRGRPLHRTAILRGSGLSNSRETGSGARPPPPRPARGCFSSDSSGPHREREACRSGSLPRKRKCRLRAVKVVARLEGRSREASSRALWLSSAFPREGWERRDGRAR